MLYSATYLIAGVPIRISSCAKAVHRLCEDYRTDADCVMEVVSSAEEVEAERAMEQGYQDTGITFGRLESLLVYRKIATGLLDHGILLMHGSSLSVDGAGYMFTALSGTGKSTHVALWRKAFGDRAVMINDDKPLIRVGDDSEPAVIYGTPWDGKHHLSNNISVPLKAIAYLERGDENGIHPVAARDILPVLWQQTFKTSDPAVTMKVMGLLSKLARKVDFYNLHCNMNDDAALVAYNGMNKEK